LYVTGTIGLVGAVMSSHGILGTELQIEGN
jgi:hypothetical protein